jgi:hypothetical protein
MEPGDSKTRKFIDFKIGKIAEIARTDNLGHKLGTNVAQSKSSMCLGGLPTHGLNSEAPVWTDASGAYHQRRFATKHARRRSPPRMARGRDGRSELDCTG